MKKTKLLAASLALLSASYAAHTDINVKIIANGEELIVNEAQHYKILYSEKTIQDRIAELGAQITKDYEGKKPILVGVLNGAAHFMNDLSKNITLSCIEDYIKVSSYENAQTSSGKVKFELDLKRDIQGRDIIIVEDLIETGLTLHEVKKHLMKKNPRSIKIVTLLRKIDCAKHQVDIDYVGFEVGPAWVTGYGFDMEGYNRNFRHIYEKVN